MFGINQRLASSDLTVNYPFEYNPNRRNSDGGGNVRGSQKNNSRKSMCRFILYPISCYFKRISRLLKNDLIFNIFSDYQIDSLLVVSQHWMKITLFILKPILPWKNSLHIIQMASNYWWVNKQMKWFAPVILLIYRIYQDYLIYRNILIIFMACDNLFWEAFKINLNWINSYPIPLK